MVSLSSPSTTKQAILVYLRKQGQATAQELADHLQISPQATRRHLKDLDLEGLLTHEAVQSGMGRPQHVYHLSPQGQEQFPESYDTFAVGLLNTLAETVGADQMGTILRKQWERKALEYQQRLGDGPLEDRVAQLVELRQAEGYMAEYHPYVSGIGAADGAGEGGDSAAAGSSQDPDPNQFVLIEHNCAIAQIAQSFPSVCGHELEMFQVALPDCAVDRITWQVEGKPHCGYRISGLGADPSQD